MKINNQTEYKRFPGCKPFKSFTPTKTGSNDLGRSHHQARVWGSGGDEGGDSVIEADTYRKRTGTTLDQHRPSLNDSISRGTR